jgi:predicted permease
MNPFVTILIWLGEIRRDLIYAIRVLIKSPGFAAVGIVSLGLGIGVTTAAFSDINALMLRDMPRAEEPRRLVMTQAPVSYPYFEHYRDQHELFSGATAFMQGVPFAVTTQGAANAKAERVFGHLVSPEYFSVLGVQAARGRVFSPDEDKPGEAPVAVVSDRFWRDRLHADPDVVGHTLRLNGQTVTIVGVGPTDFLGVMPIVPADLFVPVTVQAKVAPELNDDVLHKPETKAFTLLMRLAPGVTQESAEAALDTITRHLDETGFDAERNRKGRRVRLLPGGGILPFPPEMRPVVFGLLGTLMGLILTIACMNLANMLLARAAARRKEIAIRLAVGASRARLIRQLVAESVLLSLCGGAAGLALAYWLTSIVSKMRLPISIPFEMNIRPDGRVLLFTLTLSIVAGIAFGLAPAFAATNADVAPVLKEGGVAQLRGHRRFGMRNLLVVYQVAGSLMLLLITGFLVLGYNQLATAPTAFDPRTMYLMSLDPVRDGYSPEQAAAFFDKLPERLRRVGAVRDVSLAVVPPFSAELGSADFTASPGGADSAKTLRSAKQAIGANYFSALSVTVLSGREFNERDQRMETSGTAALPVIINQSAAQQLFGNADPIGRRITEQPQSFEVVGLVPDLNPGAFAQGVTAILYLPLTRRNFARPPAGGMTLMVRADAGSDALEGVRREIRSLDPNLSVFNMRTLAEAFDQMNAMVRVGMVFYGGIGIFGLILASVGLAGVTAYSVARRRKEIGIRMALGARQPQVLRLVMREGSAMVAIGSVLGFAGAIGIARALSSLLNVYARVFKMGTNDPRLIVGAPLLLAGLAMLACYLPARRSTKIDPLAALREE